MITWTIGLVFSPVTQLRGPPVPQVARIALSAAANTTLTPLFAVPAIAELPRGQRVSPVAEFLLGAKTMTDVQHLLYLASALARGLFAAYLIAAPATADGLACAIGRVDGLFQRAALSGHTPQAP